MTEKEIKRDLRGRFIKGTGKVKNGFTFQGITQSEHIRIHYEQGDIMGRPQLNLEVMKNC